MIPTVAPRILRAVAAFAVVAAIAPWATPAMAVCGDGVFDDLEECDDGNTADGDCCSANCTLDQNGTPCADDGNTCTDDVCNGEGTCNHFGREGSCDDGNPCTVQDTCLRLTVCVGLPVQDGSFCTNEAYCGGGGECIDGQCVGDPADCDGISSPCFPATCNPQLLRCEATQADDGTPCDDGSGCTDNDQCSGGECFGGPVDCSAFNDACHVGVCNFDAGSCFASPVANGTPCNDGNPCTDDDVCDDGECLVTPKDCSSADGPCVIGTCNVQTGQCEPAPRDDGTECNDENACTLNDQCTDGTCGGTPQQCGPSTSPCQVFQCLPQVGECALVPSPNGTPCNDGNVCTANDQCTAGTCGGTPADCSDFDTACTDGICTGSGCTAVPKADGTTCDDGVPCTTGDQCTGGVCGGSQKSCSQLDGACVQGSCNLVTGACEAKPRLDGTECNDGAFCTVVDQCIGGVCNGTGNPCRANPFCSATCDEATDSCRTPAGTPCGDDGNPCTEDTCDGEGNCGSGAVEGPCDDGLFCTTDDTCVDGQCTGRPTCAVGIGCSDTCSEDEDACRQCGKPFANGRCVVNAVFVLQGALDLRVCEICTCDVDASGTVTASDALSILRTCAALPATFVCPDPAPTTTTTTIAL